MKKSMIFGVLAMFAVSALSVQNVNAQNTSVKTNPVKQEVNKEKKTQANEAINQPKAKPQPDNEISTTKGEMRNAQKPLDKTVSKTTKELKKETTNVNDPKVKKGAKPEKNENQVGTTNVNKNNQNDGTLKAKKAKKAKKGSKPEKNENQVGTTNVNKNDLNDGTLQSKKVDPKPNSAVKPKTKKDETTGTSNNNNPEK